MILAGTISGEFAAWDPRSDEWTWKAHTPSGCMNWAVASADGREVAFGCDNSAVVFCNVATGASVYTDKTHTNFVWGTAASPDGKFWASSSSDKLALLFDRKYTVLSRLESDRDGGVVFAVAFSPDSRLLVSGSHSGLHLWDCQTGAKVATNTLGGGTVRSLVCCARPTQRVIAGLDSGVIGVYDVHTLTEINQSAVHSRACVCVSVNQQCTLLVSASYDHTAAVVDAVSLQVLLKYAGHES
eukprot:TRINITY_DN9092_c0_g1_i3.p1 TRINITY_DN9092_c0_g1~~TRINITY_DN9092_c0_g1_i3.p1  ORF type:complete len:242 (-),score=38.47 TRINITY_DN9092_c0_g1_i3:377-1102(-)